MVVLDEGGNEDIPFPGNSGSRLTELEIFFRKEGKGKRYQR